VKLLSIVSIVRDVESIFIRSPLLSRSEQRFFLQRRKKIKYILILNQKKNSGTHQFGISQVKIVQRERKITVESLIKKKSIAKVENFLCL
jgi:hypothetical protein